MRRLSDFNRWCLAAILMISAVVVQTRPASAEAWKFGVMPDTQWTVPNDGKNPHGVAVGIIEQVNAEFIKAGVEFVVQVGGPYGDGDNRGHACQGRGGQVSL